MTYSELQYPLWTALVTPMTPRGEISYNDLEHLLREQEKAGNGVVVLGSTGEGINLEEQERREIIRFISSLKLSTAVMAGVGGFHLQSQLEWIDFLATQRIDGYLMVTPLYAKPGPNGQYQWFKALMDRSSRPVMLYNIPGRTGVSLHLEAVERLSDHPRLWSIKESSGSVAHFDHYRKAAGGRALYSGDDGLLPDFAPYGAVGVVSVAGNVWPEAARHFTRRVLDGNAADEEISLWKQATGTLFTAPNPIPSKALLKEEGRIGSDTLRSPLDRADMTDADLQTVKKASSDMQEWFHNRMKHA